MIDSEFLALASSNALVGALVMLLVVSYLLYALFTWSFVKPCKYIGISAIIVGVLLLIARFSSSALIDAALSEITVPASLLAAVFKPLLTMGIIYILVGIGLIITQRMYFKSKKKEEVKEEPKKETKKTDKK